MACRLVQCISEMCEVARLCIDVSWAWPVILLL